MRPPLLAWIAAVALVSVACFPPPRRHRGAAGVQEAPDEGPDRSSDPIARAPGGPSGAPATAEGPARGVHAAPDPQPGPVPVWPRMEFEPQRPLRVASAGTGARPHPGAGSGGSRGGGAPRPRPTLDVAAVDDPSRTGPEDVVEPTYGEAPEGGAATEYPSDARTRDEVRAGMESVRQRILRCFDEGFPGGLLTVEALITPDGLIEGSSVHEPLEGGQFGCVEGAMMEARFRAVEGQPLRVVYPYAHGADEE